MWTQKITVASVIKKKVKMRGSYQQTSVENAQVDLIQSQLTISKSTTLLQIAKQQELFRLKKTRVVRQQILVMMVSMMKFLLISSTWPVVVEMVTPNW
jgi:hypothetical protein